MSSNKYAAALDGNCVPAEERSNQQTWMRVAPRTEQRDSIIKERRLSLPSVLTFSVTSYLNLAGAVTSNKYASTSENDIIPAEEHGKQQTLLKCTPSSSHSKI